MTKYCVSILIITYNHENFIGAAIESVLMQKTTFDFEIIIGEDFSRDSTRKVCEEYAEKYPKIIKLLPSEKNWGMIPNFMRTFNACTGSYIALCEGDDYWIDPYKLQKQTDFLQENLDFTTCFTDYKIFYENKNEYFYPKLSKQYFKKNTFTIYDIIKQNFIPTLTVVFRNKCFDKFPNDYVKLYPGDWPLHILNAKKGKIKFLPFESAVYRKHDLGICSAANPIDNFKKYLITIDYMRKWFLGEDKAQLAFNIAKAYVYKDILKYKFKNLFYER